MISIEDALKMANARYGSVKSNGQHRYFQGTIDRLPTPGLNASLDRATMYDYVFVGNILCFIEAGNATAIYTYESHNDYVNNIASSYIFQGNAYYQPQIFDQMFQVIENHTAGFSFLTLQGWLIQIS